MYVYIYVFIKLHLTTQSGPVILVILCHSHRSSRGGINDYLLRKPLIRRDKGDTLSLLVQFLLKLRVPCAPPPASLLISTIFELAATGPTLPFLHLFLVLYMYVCMYVCMYVRTYVRMYVCTYVCMYVCMYVNVCIYVCICMCIYVCMYICMYVCMYVFIKLHITTQSGPVILVILCHSH